MTKQVRLENADTSSYKVKVQYQNKVNDEWIDDGPVVNLDFPTSLQHLFIHATRRFIVYEEN